MKREKKKIPTTYSFAPGSFYAFPSESISCPGLSRGPVRALLTLAELQELVDKNKDEEGAPSSLPIHLL